MAAEPRQLARPPWSQLALGAVVVVLAALVVRKELGRAFNPHGRVVAVVILSLVVVLFAGVAWRVVQQVRRLLRGHTAEGSPLVVWVATLIAGVVGPLVASTTVAGATAAPPPIVAPVVTAPAPSSHTMAWWPVGGAGAIPLAMVARRRRDTLVQRRAELDDTDIDAAIVQFRQDDPAAFRGLRALIGHRRHGVLVLDDETVAPPPAAEENDESIVAVLLATDGAAALVAFARVGEELALGDDAAELLERSAVVLGTSGRCQLTATPADTLRALALRHRLDDVVIYLGRGEDLDDEIRQRCVAVGPGPQRRGDSLDLAGRRWRYAPASATAAAPPVSMPQLALRFVAPPSTVRVRLLRAEPTVEGLSEPFAATLRRHCIEMVAYLALHEREPVTGDRLRTRVLSRDGDASLRTLANTASAVRRSLGDEGGEPRLRPVSSAGLYQLRHVDCDLNQFHRLIADARDPLAVDVADTLRRALELVDSEPLAAVLRGFEWFIPEGHLARLQRDGEWAALRLAAEARETGDVDLAFWAIEQGRLLDPYSDVLEAALHRVPRLREFGRDGGRRAQDEAVGAG